MSCFIFPATEQILKPGDYLLISQPVLIFQMQAQIYWLSSFFYAFISIEVIHMVYFGTRLSENISRREPEGYDNGCSLFIGIVFEVLPPFCVPDNNRAKNQNQQERHSVQQVNRRYDLRADESLSL